MISVTALPPHSLYFDFLMYGGATAVAVGVIGLAILFFWQPKKDVIMSDNSDHEAGDDNTIIGTPPKRMGSRNTIVSLGDGDGNVILNQGGLTVGAGAGYDRFGTIIGSGAGANLGRKPKADKD